MSTVWVTTGGTYADGETGTVYVTTFGVMADGEGVAPPVTGTVYQMIISWLVAIGVAAASTDVQL